MRPRSERPELLPGALKGILDEGGISYRENGVSYKLTCPLCEKKEKLYIRKRDGRFRCWKCANDGFQGWAEFALRELVSVPMSVLRQRLYGGGIPQAVLHLEIELVDWFGDEEVQDSDIVEMPNLQWPLDFYPVEHKHASKGVEYLAGRGVSVELAKQYGLRFNPATNRVIIPIESNGQLLGWQARSILSDDQLKWVDDRGFERQTPKILTSDELSGVRDHVLMFPDRLHGSKHAVLAEGPFDGIKAHLCGGNVVTMGTSTSKQQLNLIRNAGVEDLYLATDPDAMETVSKLVRDMGSDMRVWRMEIPATAPDGSKNDLGRMSCEEAYDLFRSARRVHGGMLFVSLSLP